MSSHNNKTKLISFLNFAKSQKLYTNWKNRLQGQRFPVCKSCDQRESESRGSELSAAIECFHHKRCAILTLQIRNLTAVDANCQPLGVVHKKE